LLTGGSNKRAVIVVGSEATFHWEPSGSGSSRWNSVLQSDASSAREVDVKEGRLRLRGLRVEHRSYMLQWRHVRELVVGG